MNTKAKWLVTFLVLFAIIGSVYYGFKVYTNNMYKPIDPSDNSYIKVEITKGSSLGLVASTLYDMNIIKNGSFFKSRVEKRGLEKDIQSGEFDLSRSMSVDEIIDVITTKVDLSKMIKLVIPEGFERKLIAKRVEEMELGTEEKFLELSSDKARFEAEYPFLSNLNEGQSLEGFLFPATYDVSPEEGEESIIRKMLSAFESRMENNFNEGEYNGLNLNQMITLASIIEREIKIDDERPIAASVFYNRINQGMMLQSCATVQFILGERKPVLSTEETKIQSPYNTYINQGLPPSPIASPGMKSIMAAINPAETDYLFFVKTGEDGSHTFTKTFEEHLNQKRNMIR